jgi:hypothetical protein
MEAAAGGNGSTTAPSRSRSPKGAEKTRPTEPKVVVMADCRKCPTRKRKTSQRLILEEANQTNQKADTYRNGERYF